MKRIIPLTCLLLLLFAASACAEIWFPSGNTIHRDPICIRNDFSLESCNEQVLRLTDEELEAGDYLPCSHCCAYATDTTSDQLSLTDWYYNPYGGEHLHQDAYCVSVSAKYQPLTPVSDAPDAALLPETPCNICGGDWPPQITHLFDNAVWNASPLERADLLPGVWTVPSADALPVEDVVAHAKEAAATISRKTVHSAIPLHYDYDAQGNPRETWRVVVTTTLMHPVCVVNFDALTGECLGMHISREYSDMMLLADPEKLELEVAEGTKVEILANRVNFRNKPYGGESTDSMVITRFNKGDTLTLLAEKRNGSNLWYYVSTPKNDKGYVDATFAQIMHKGQKRHGNSALTENLLAYLTELRRWQIENGFLKKDESGTFVFTRDESLNIDTYREAVLALMHRHSITATVGGTAPFILANHYGTADLWEIFGTAMDIIPGLHVDDWHSPDFPTEAEQKQLADSLAAVDAEYQ